MCETVMFVTGDLVAREEHERTYRIGLVLPSWRCFRGYCSSSLLLLYSLIEEIPGDCDLPAAVSLNFVLFSLGATTHFSTNLAVS